MNIYNIKVHYLHHSGFAVETQNNILIFDYYKDSFPGKKSSIENGIVSHDFIDTKKNITVFVSHSHEDHFNPVILEWEALNENIQYVFSSDVNISPKVKNHHSISRYSEITLENGLYTKTFGSTDIGVSFLVQVDGITFFHAGDLNMWYWKEDSKSERGTAKYNFEQEIQKLKGQKIDISFFPVDPRLEEYYGLGGKFFIEQINPTIFFPMHFWNKYSVTQKFKNSIEPCGTKIMTIDHIGETFNLRIRK